MTRDVLSVRAGISSAAIAPFTCTSFQSRVSITEFRRGNPPVVSLNRDLTGSTLDHEDAHPGLTGRWRATLAHQGGHFSSIGRCSSSTTASRRSSGSGP